MGLKRKSQGNADKYTEEYRERRAKNNNAVKRSRDKTKKRAMEASQRVEQLRVDNENLKATIRNMTEELQYLKDLLFMPTSDLTPDLARCVQEVLNEEETTDPETVRNLVQQIKQL